MMQYKASKQGQPVVVPGLRCAVDFVRHEFGTQHILQMLRASKVPTAYALSDIRVKKLATFCFRIGRLLSCRWIRSLSPARFKVGFRRDRDAFGEYDDDNNYWGHLIPSLLVSVQRWVTEKDADGAKINGVHRGSAIFAMYWLVAVHCWDCRVSSRLCKTGLYFSM